MSFSSSPLARLPWLPLIVLGTLAALPFGVSPWVQDLALKIMLYGVFALSLGLLVGTTGLVSLGHAAFFGVAAYAAVLATPSSDAGSLPLLLLISLAAAAAYALVVGSLCLRTQGVYFIMVTLAFAQMAYFLFHDTPFAGGSDGLYLTLRPQWRVGDKVLLDLDQPLHLWFTSLAALALAWGLLALIARSRFGHALAGIRVNEQRMRAAGFATYGYKLAAFVLAGTLAGLAGFLMAVRNGVVNPEMLSWHESGAVLLMLILGGTGSLRGALLGAAAFVLLKEFFASEALLGPLATRWQLTLGITMIFFVALLPQGLAGGWAQLRQRLSKRGAA